MQGYVHLTLRFHLEGTEWVGVCVELGTSTFAQTLAECRNELEELVTDHLEVLGRHWGTGAVLCGVGYRDPS